MTGMALSALPASAAVSRISAVNAAASVAVQGRSALATPSNRVAATPAGREIEIGVGVQLRNRAGAIAFEQAVSTPGNTQYRQFLTPGAWEKRFAPKKASVQTVSAWLTSQGITVESVSADRMTIAAKAPAATIERAFGTELGEYHLSGHVLRLAATSLSVPSSIASLISGVMGVNQHLNTPTNLTGAQSAASLKSGRGTGKPALASPSHKQAGEGEEEGPLPPPLGFRNAPPCSKYFGERLATSVPTYGDRFASKLPWAVCGYKPAQFQSAYDLSEGISKGIDGAGVTVGITDAYASSTLFADAKKYDENNQPNAVLSSSQFAEVLSKTFNDEELCEAPEWATEQTLDVEAVHAMAPGANILYVGAKNCEAALYESVQFIVDHHLASVITDSWASLDGDILVPAGEREAFDNVLLMAGGTGIGVQFSSGDEGDNFPGTGITAPDYPGSSPYATAVGGTSLQVGANGSRVGEYGWSTSRSLLCTKTLEEDGLPGCTPWHRNWIPPAPGAFDYGGGGGTSFNYPEPEYQTNVVPAAYAERNSRITKVLNRVVPDISMDADPSTGMLIGITQTFEATEANPEGKVEYGEYRLGGTSLASPLLAGALADADQAAGGSLGFINPLAYSVDASTTPTGAFYDVPGAIRQAMVRNDYLNAENESEGILTSVRVIGYEGLEEYCSGTEECTLQDVALKATPGFDSMTGIGSVGPNFISVLQGASK